LGGDFNLAGIDWDTGYVPPGSSLKAIKEYVISIFQDTGLSQMQRESTRCQNLLDLFCVNKPSLVKTIISIPGISDHSIVLADCDLKAVIIKKPPRKVYQWSKADWQQIREHTVSYANKFLAIAPTRSANANYIDFKTYMEDLLNSLIPSKFSKYKPDLPWFTTELRRLTKRKGRRFASAKRARSRKGKNSKRWKKFLDLEKLVRGKIK